MKRVNTDIKNNMEKILNGEMEILFVPAFRDRLKKEKWLGDCICSECGIGEFYNGKFLSLEIDHIDGNKHNNVKNNLRFLCPNCHSQTDTFRSKNYKKEKSSKWINDETLINSIKLGGSIANMLRRAGLKPVGDNYNRVHRLIKKYNIEVPKGVVSYLENSEVGEKPA